MNNGEKLWRIIIGVALIGIIMITWGLWGEMPQDRGFYFTSLVVGLTIAGILYVYDTEISLPSPNGDIYMELINETHIRMFNENNETIGYEDISDGNIYVEAPEVTVKFRDAQPRKSKCALSFLGIC